jgi:hypothetical protein
MTKNSTTESAKKRIKVKTLKATETKLSTKQMKKVKGGYQTGGMSGGSGVPDLNITVKTSGLEKLGGGSK